MFSCNVFSLSLEVIVVPFAVHAADNIHFSFEQIWVCYQSASILFLKQ